MNPVDDDRSPGATASAGPDRHPGTPGSERDADGCANGAGSDPFTSLPPLHRRRWCHPGSLPTQMAVTSLDLDATKNCNLRCVYCFKGGTVRPGANACRWKWPWRRSTG